MNLITLKMIFSIAIVSLFVNHNSQANSACRLQFDYKDFHEMETIDERALILTYDLKLKGYLDVEVVHNADFGVKFTTSSKWIQTPNPNSQFPGQSLETQNVVTDKVEIFRNKELLLSQTLAYIDTSMLLNNADAYDKSDQHERDLKIIIELLKSINCTP